MKKVFLVLLMGLGLAAATRVHGQGNGPTLEETSAWIVQTLTLYGGDNSPGMQYIIKDVTIDGCTFSYTYNWNTLQKLEPGKRYSDFARTTVPLNAVTLVQPIFGGNSGDVPGGFVLQTGRQALIEFSEGPANNQAMVLVASSPQGPLPNGTVPQNPAVMAPRLIKAFQHAVDLCRAMYPPPQEQTEPF